MKFVHRITWGKSGPNGPKVENIPSAIAMAVNFDYVMYFELKSSMASPVLLKNEPKTRLRRTKKLPKTCSEVAIQYSES